MYAVNYKKSKNPVWNLSIFKIRTFRITTFGSLFSRIGIGGVPFLLPLLFQIGFHYSPTLSGALIFPMAASTIIVKFCIRYILKIIWL